MPSEYANDLMARVGLDTTEWKKGITDLNAGIKHIETGFQASAALMDDWSNSSEGLGKRVESLNDKLALQKQKLEKLKKAYDEEVAANGAASKAAESLAAKMFTCQNEIKRTESDIDKYTSKLESLATTSDKVASRLDSFAGKTKTFSTVAAGGLALLAGGLVKAGATADELNTLAKQTGLTVEEIQKFKYASDLIDVSLEDTTGALAKMTKNMASTSAETKAAWDTLGVSTTKLDGSAQGITDTFYNVLKALSKVTNETERDQLAMQIFGKSANSLAGIIDDGGAALREYGEEAEKLGLIMSQEAVDGANAFNDVIDSTKAKVTAALGKAFSENAADLEETAQAIADAIIGLVNAFVSMPPVVSKAGIVVLGLSAALSPMLKLASSGVTIFSKLTSAIKKKTTETIAATDAETAHAGALKAVGTAAKTATPYLIAIGAAIAVVTALENAHDEAIAKKYDDLTEKSNEHYDGLIQKAQEAAADEEKAALERISTINKTYDEKEKKAEKDYKAEKKRIEDEKKLYEKAHNARMDQLKAERDLKISNIKLESDAQISVIQEQIDNLNAITEAEDKAETERQNQEKLAELKRAIDAAATYSDKVEAEKEYNDFLRQLEREKSRETRELQIKDLEKKIENIETESEKRQNAVDAEYEAAKKLEDDKRAYSLDIFEQRLIDLEDFVEDCNAILEKERNDEIEAINSQSKAKIADLEAEIKRLTDEKAGKEKMYSDLSEWEQENTTFWGGTNYMGKVKNQAERNAEKAAAIASGEKIDTSPFANITGHDWRVGANAEGTDNWRGGLTWVHEKGGEIINLPRGTQIIPHDVSMEYARAVGRASVTHNNTETNNYNYGAKQHVTVLSIGNRTVAKVIEPAMSVRSANNINGRRRSGG